MIRYVFAVSLAAGLLWLAYQLGRAHEETEQTAACHDRIAGIDDALRRAADARDRAAVLAERAARADTDAERSAARETAAIIQERIIHVPIEVPADCRGPVPDGLRDAVEAARAAANAAAGG
ncbi:hypothetical protein [Coralloluteibacterium thermophilus]|uniref:DUF2570 domain-containing protein n=1 Tax=Coralloluteibacterium thermophilum TaxID=2707049 RepID=A0ABV9NHS7_9GAMM